MHSAQPNGQTQSRGKNLPGVSGLSVYLPKLRVPLDAWCEWTASSPDKVQNVIGRSFRVPADHENVYTMAANAALRLIRQYSVDPARVGWLGLGTESSTDNAVGSVIVRGMVDRALEMHGLPRLSRQVEVPEFKHACLGGIYALKGALRYVAADGQGQCAIVVCADVAEYPRGSSGEPTQGAGAVAALVEQRPTLFEVDLSRGGIASAYRGPDFRKPSARHDHASYAAGTSRRSDFPVFSGKYSTAAYIDEVAHALRHLAARSAQSVLAALEEAEAVFLHRPYHLMPLQALSFLLTRGLVESRPGDDHLRALCEESGVREEDLAREANASPDLYARLGDDSTSAFNPYPATSKVASALRRSKSFERYVRRKASWGSDALMDLGNLYSASLPAWLAAGFFQAAQTPDYDWTGRQLLAIGYGSGDAAEALPLCPVPGWRNAATRIGFDAALRGAVDLSRGQYEAWHDHRDTTDIRVHPEDEFVISRIGDRYEEAFQDLGVEYYDFVCA